MKLLAQSSLDQLPVAPSGGPGGFRLPAFLQDVPVLIGIALALLVILLLWARFFRRRSRRHADLRVASHVLVETGMAESSEHKHRHHRRRHRREHRPRNPTLAETGGLPPPRQTDELPPSL